MSPSNVMFSDGELDPWRAVSLHSVEDNSPKRQSTTTIPANGKTPGGGQFFGFLVSGGFHCPDLGNVARLNNTSINPRDAASDTQASADTAHTLFIDALNTWLPAFQKHDVSNSTTLTPADVSNGGSSGSSSTKKNAGGRNMVSGGTALVSALVLVVVYLVL